MLSEVGIDDQQKQTGVEELGIEHSIGNGSELLRVGIFSDPSNESNDSILKNKIDSNNDE